MKKKYIKPTQQIIVLQHRTTLLSGSPKNQSPSPDAEEYDDWLGYIPSIEKDKSHLA
jgi:hypothetical protein